MTKDSTTPSLIESPIVGTAWVSKKVKIKKSLTLCEESNTLLEERVLMEIGA